MGGTTTSEARRSLETSKRVAGLAQISDAFRGGVFSSAQANAIAGAAAADPSAENRLIALAASTSVAELREECLRTKAAADPDRDATYQRIHARRYLRGFTDGEGARNLAVRGVPDRVCPIEKALEPIIDDLFEQARAEGRHEPREAYAFDALVILAEREQAPAAADDEKPRRPKPRYLGLLHLDVEALTRGQIEGEETCEIVGLGPVPVRVARELLGDAVLKLVITKGVDVVNVTHLDHREPWANTHHTRSDEIDHLCLHDHDLKTTKAWSLVAGTGRRAFVGPDDPRHPRNKPPP